MRWGPQEMLESYEVSRGYTSLYIHQLYQLLLKNTEDRLLIYPFPTNGIPCFLFMLPVQVAPGQHEMSPVFRTANVSCDSNVCFMEVMNREAAKLGLQVLFHEKPFAGINGSGKHANWSVGTDTGFNFFYPGKTEDIW